MTPLAVSANELPLVAKQGCSAGDRSLTPCLTAPYTKNSMITSKETLTRPKIPVSSSYRIIRTVTCSIYSQKCCAAVQAVRTVLSPLRINYWTGHMPQQP